MSWADRVEQVLRLIDGVVRGAAPVATGPVPGATPAGTTAAPALGSGSSWAS